LFGDFKYSLEKIETISLTVFSGRYSINEHPKLM